VRKSVVDGLEPYKKEIKRQVTDEDVERLLKIPIRRISLYDINKAKEEMDLIKARLAQVRKHLANLVEYAVSFLEGIAKKLEKDWPRRTELSSFRQVDVKEAAKRDLPLRYDSATGYLGTSVSGGDVLAHVSPYDKALVIRRTGIYTAMTVPEKLFVDKGALYCGSAEKEELSKVLFTVVYRDGHTGFPHIKRCRIEQYINNRDYFLVPDGAQILLFSTEEDFDFTVVYEPKPRMKVKEEAFSAGSFDEKGLKAQGVRLASKPAASAQIGVSKLAAKAARAAEAAELFPEAGSKPRAKAKGAAKVEKPRLTRATKVSKKPEEAPKSGLRARAEAIAAQEKAAAKKPRALKPKKPAAKKAKRK
jgi:topoisomerase IV subunit A